MSDYIAENEYGLLMDLLEISKEVECFEVEGRIFLGNRVAAIKRFIKSGNSDFYVWLQDHYRIID